MAAQARADTVLAIDLDSDTHAPSPLRVVVDADDDDEDETRDCDESTGITGNELADLRVAHGQTTTSVHAEGGLRLIVNGNVVSQTTLSERIHVQGTRASTATNDAALVFDTAGTVRRVPLTVVRVAWLDADNAPIDPTKAALGISRRITHDRSLPRSADAEQRSEDPESARLEIEDPSATSDVFYARLLAHDEHGTLTDSLRHVALHRVGSSSRFRSAFLRFVSDATDKSAPEVSDQLLRVRLRDRVSIELGDARAPLTHDIAVGLPGRRGGERASLRGRLRIHVLRFEPDGPTVIGEDLALVERLAREQVVIANEIWAQCFIDFGRPEDAEVRIVDPPPPALLAVSDGDGLPAAGDGEIRLRAGGKTIGPIKTRADASPAETVKDLVEAFKRAGFSAQASLNPKTENGAAGSADVVVRDLRGAPVTLSLDGQAPLTTDSRQRLSIGRVDLKDGIQEFDNDVSAAGTIEERTLIKLTGDSDPSTIDVILINHFASLERQGEAFIESDVSSTANTLLFDRNAVRYQRQAWVQAHELGHVLMDEPFHPDNLGPDRPYLLMDSDARQGRVTGPKRLSDAECKRARRRSGPGASPVLLQPAP